MNLLQAIRRDKPNTIRVGTQNGGHFIYIGRALTLIRHNSRERQRVDTETFAQCEKYKQVLRDRAKAREELKKRGIEPAPPSKTDIQYRFVLWEPILEREVVESCNSTCDGDRIYIVTGCESLVEYSGNTHIDAIQMETARKMVEDIYQGEVQHLMRLYRVLDGARTVTDRIKAAQDCVNAENWFRKDYYGILNHPEGFIAEIRRQYEIKKREEGRR
jgi:hypothetical protein